MESSCSNRPKPFSQCSALDPSLQESRLGRLKHFGEIFALAPLQSVGGVLLMRCSYGESFLAVRLVVGEGKDHLHE